METFELVRAAVPTRAEKRRVARTLGYSDESTLYKWSEDPDGSGKRNPIDCVEILLDHALLHHPDAALAIVQHLEARCARALGRRGAALPLPELLVVVQPASERESLEAVGALSSALRQIVLSGSCDAPELLREVEEAERAMHRTAVMLRAAIEADVQAAANQEVMNQAVREVSNG